jgi:ABC-type glycerol-3-phosphate transport system substrate-binding protein
MKKFMFTFVVLFALALVAAQCGQPQVIEKEVVVTKEVEVEKVVTVEVEKQVEVMVTPTPEPTGPVKLVFWSFLDQEYPNMYPFFQEKLAGFQEMHPDVEIEFVPIPYEGSDAKYLAAFAGRENAPDMWMGKVPYFAGGLKVADPAPEDIQQAWEDILVENIKPYLQWEGDYYGFPIESDLGVMLYYNTDMYQEAGLDPAQPPPTSGYPSCTPGAASCTQTTAPRRTAI